MTKTRELIRRAKILFSPFRDEDAVGITVHDWSAAGLETNVCRCRSWLLIRELVAKVGTGQVTQELIRWCKCWLPMQELVRWCWSAGICCLVTLELLLQESAVWWCRCLLLSDTGTIVESVCCLVMQETVLQVWLVASASSRGISREM